MSKNNTDIDSYKFRHLTTSESDLDQYNALLRYAFQVTEQDLSDKISALSLFDCTLAFANNGKPIGSPDNGGYFTLHTTEQGSTDVAYSGVTAVTIK